MATQRYILASSSRQVKWNLVFELGNGKTVQYEKVTVPGLYYSNALTPWGGGKGGLDSPVVFLLPSAMAKMRASGRQFAGVQAAITNGSCIMLDSFETTEVHWTSVFPHGHLQTTRDTQRYPPVELAQKLGMIPPSRSGLPAGLRHPWH